MTGMTRHKINGIISEGFQAVKEQFERHFAKGLEENAQLCVYFKGKKVVDLWGVRSDNTDYDGDTLTNVFSSSKVLTSICMATLVEKQLLDYSDKVVKHWPEYGNGDPGKELMTVAKILQHEGGMPIFSQTLMLADIQKENIKKNCLGKIIEKEKLSFPPPKAKTKREYHAFTRGTILNEIFRRVDPQRRTIGECLRQDISTTLNADAFIGLGNEDFSRSYKHSISSISGIILQGFVPHSLRRTAPNVVDLVKFGSFVLPYIKAKPMLEHLTNRYNVKDMLRKFNLADVKTGEIPSANGQCSAGGIAKIAAMMANKGKIDGIPILSEKTWQAFHANVTDKLMYPSGDMSSFTQGGVNIFKHVHYPVAFTKHNNDCRLGFVGWMGLGGSVFQWHPEYNIGFGYVPTFLAFEDVSNQRGAFLQKKVLECVKAIIKE